MSTKLRSVTLRVEPELLDRVEQLAREDRRPVSQLLRILVADAVAGRGDAYAPPYRAVRA